MYKCVLGGWRDCDGCMLCCVDNTDADESCDTVEIVDAVGSVDAVRSCGKCHSCAVPTRVCGKCGESIEADLNGGFFIDGGSGGAYHADCVDAMSADEILDMLAVASVSELVREYTDIRYVR